MMNSVATPWYRQLNGYHWFVLIVAALGWLFDCLDQQLFNLARVPAMKELLAPSPGELPTDESVAHYGTLATAIFLIGWASGGLFFGVLGDRIGRAKTMLLTILIYSLCTGLSALSVGFWDFAFYRFLTGLGVGGEFAVGVALVAEVMPDRARPYALGFLQALSALGNISAALISIGFGELEQAGILGGYQIRGVTVTAWRAMFVVGTFPALLALVIRRRLKEPERWQAVAHEGAVAKKLGSYRELLGDPRWRHRAIVGLVLASSGVIGLWGIGFFSIDLNRSVFRKVFQQEFRDAGQAQWDRDVLRLILDDSAALETWARRVRPTDMLNSRAESEDAYTIMKVMIDLRTAGQAVTLESVLSEIEGAGASTQSRSQIAEYLSGEPSTRDGEALANRIVARSAELTGRLTRWAGYTSMMLNIGAFIGIYGFGLVTGRIGRRPTFAIAFIAAGLSTALVFWYMDDITDVFWMIPLMGVCQLSLFGGYAIYFPELFPTHLRSTGTSFCYNVGRFVAASGPLALGILTSKVFAHQPEPMRYAGVTMCAVFLVGLLALPFAPETKDQPLPE